MIADFINGIFELFGGVAISFSIAKVLKDKKVKGVSLIPVVFFTTWGFWNLYYYPSLGQSVSFWAGIGVAIANLIWLILLIKYRKEK